MSTDPSKDIDVVTLGESILSLYSRTPDSAGLLPIYKAVVSGREKAVQTLVSPRYGYEVDSKVGIRFRYISSKWRTYIDIVEFPYHEEDDSGYRYDDADYERNVLSTSVTLLWLASALGHTEVVRVLADAGASVFFITNNIDVLLAAVCNGHSGVVQFLIERGAHRGTKDLDEALYASAQNGFTDIVQKLIGINKMNYLGELLTTASYNGNTEVVKCLVTARVDRDAKCGTDGSSDTALLRAVILDHTDTVKCLIDAGASCNKCNTFGMTPLLSAIVSGNVEIAELLIEAGADTLSSENIMDETPLTLACKADEADLFKVLVAAGAAESVERATFINLLKYLISAGHTEPMQIVACMLAKGCGINDVCDGESTLTCTIDPESIGNLNSLRMALILAKDCNVRLENTLQYLVFRDAVDYSVFEQTLLVDDAVSLPEDIHMTLPRVSELIQCPGKGSVSSISGNRAIEITDCMDEKVRDFVRDYNTDVKDVFTKAGYVTMKECGSAAEGTKVGFPDEFDYTLKFIPQNAGEIVDFKGGYKFYNTLGSNSAETSLFGRGSKKFHDQFGEYVREEKLNTIGREVSSPTAAVQGGGQANTAVTTSWQEPETGNNLLVSIDLVPVLFFENKWPEYLTQRTWMMDKENLKSRGFALVAKPPHKKSSLAKEISEEDRVKLWRISCPHLETEHIACLEPRVKDAYIAAKCLRDPDICRIMLRDTDGILHNVEKHVPSYLLKTAFLHNVEDFRRSDRSLIEMVYIIYSDLEYCLSREFLPLFWQHDVNTLAGLRVDPKKALRATNLMRVFVGRMYLKETDCHQLSESMIGKLQLKEFEQESGNKDKKKQFRRRDEVTACCRTHPQSEANELGECWDMPYDRKDKDDIIGNKKMFTCVEEVTDSRSLPCMRRTVIYCAFTETGEPHPDEYKYDVRSQNSKKGQN